MKKIFDLIIDEELPMNTIDQHTSSASTAGVKSVSIHRQKMISREEEEEVLRAITMGFFIMEITDQHQKKNKNNRLWNDYCKNDYD